MKIKNLKDIDSISLITDEFIFSFYDKLNKIGNDRQYPYNLLKIEDDGFIPTYKNIELKLIDPKLFLFKKKGGSTNGIIQVMLF